MFFIYKKGTCFLLMHMNQRFYILGFSVRKKPCFCMLLSIAFQKMPISPDLHYTEHLSLFALHFLGIFLIHLYWQEPFFFHWIPTSYSVLCLELIKLLIYLNILNTYSGIIYS